MEENQGVTSVRQDVIQDSFCGGYLGAVADGVSLPGELQRKFAARLVLQIASAQGSGLSLL